VKDIIVTGGRNYSDVNHVNSVLSLFDIGLLIQGGAPGADHLARMWADNHRIECITVSADWEKHGKAAGPFRNSTMLSLHPNAIVIAFPGGKGTADCVKKALSRGMTVLVVAE